MTHPSTAGPRDQTPTRRPKLIIFDVNETLSDMSPIASRFSEVGLPEHLAATWFAALLRDGFALTIAGGNPSFADLASDGLRLLLAKAETETDHAVAHIMGSFAKLPIHSDVVEGIRALSDSGLRLVTLSNGATDVAQGLLDRNDIASCFESLLSVQDAPAWKPAAAAYRHALEACQVEAKDAMLVAVHPWDIHGASEAGLMTSWINRSDANYPSVFLPADLQASSLTELAKLLAPPPR